jgi:GTPase SAR1 family protein
MTRVLASDLSTFYRSQLCPRLEEPAKRRLDDAIKLLTHRQFDEHQRVLKQRRADAERPFMLFIVGAGNAGKSSLINAIAGRTVAPVSIEPLTWKIDVYEQAERESATLRWVDERTTEHTIDGARALCEREEAEAQQADQRGTLYTGRIVEAVWRLSETTLPANVQLVDTPGVHQIRTNLRGTASAGQYRPLVGGSEHLIGLAQVYFHRADGVLWVLDGTCLDDVAGRAVEDLSFFAKEQYAVINKVDAVSGVTTDEIIAYGRQRLGQHFKHFLPLSARQACKDPQRGGLPELMSFVRESFLADARSGKVRATVSLVGAELGAAERITRGERQRLEGSLEAINRLQIEIAAEAERVCVEHQRQARHAISQAFSTAAATVDASWIQGLNGPESARRLHLQNLIPTKAVKDVAQRHLTAAVDEVLAAGKLKYALLRLQSGRYDFAGRQTTTEVEIDSRMLDSSARWVPGHYDVNAANIGDWSAEEVGATAGAAIIGALIGGPFGFFLGGVLGKVFGEERKIKKAVSALGEQVLAAGVTAGDDVARTLRDTIQRAVTALETAGAKVIEKQTGLSPKAVVEAIDDWNRWTTRIVGLRTQPLVPPHLLLGGP